MRCFRSALSSFLFCLAALPLFADGISQTESIYRKLTDAGYSCTMQALVSTAEETFPQNIIVTIPPVSTEEKEIKSTIFAFTQDFAFSNEDFIAQFLQELKNTELEDQVLVLLSADESDFSILRGDTSIGGTEVYTMNVEDEDSVCAIVFEPDSGLSAVPGAGGTVSPLWLSQALVEASQKSGLNLSFPGNLMLLYRLGILDGDERLFLFLKEDVPSIEIRGSPTALNAHFLANAALSIQHLRSSQWDMHYASIKAGDLVLWINEILFVFGHMAVVAAMLLTLAFSNFASSSSNRAMQKDFGRTWYMLPATVFLTALLLEFFQLIFSPLKNPIALFIIKVSLTLFVMQILLSIQIKKRFKISFRVLGYESVVMSAFCLILFSFVDISLVFAFALAYAVSLFCRKLKKPAPLILAALLTVSPFVPYLLRLAFNADREGLILVAKTSFGVNLLFACVLFLALSDWCRIVISLKVLVSEEKNIKTSVRQIILTSGISTVCCCLIILTPILIMEAKKQTPAQQVQTKITQAEEESQSITVSYEESSFRSLSARHIIVSSSLTIYRYEISLTSSQGIPLYESDYEYILDDSNRAQFRLPDWPSGTLEILYSADEETQNEITVDAYIYVSDTELKKVSKTITTKADGT